MTSDSCCNDKVVDMWTVMETEQSVLSKGEGFDCFFDFCLLDIVRRRTIGVGK